MPAPPERTEHPRRIVRDELERPLTCSIRATEIKTSLSRGVIKKLLRSGELESIKVGKRRLIYVKSVDKLLGIAP